jgi:hypothetical protein
MHYFQLLDCLGLEQYFHVDRRLFLKERLVNPWMFFKIVDP